MMKLVDILARDLNAWPERVHSLSQMRNGYIVNGRGFDGVAFDLLEIAEETLIAGAIVTREQWQAAVDALDTPNTEEWTGEGLPPVGVDVEFIHSGVEDWVRCHVVGYYKGHLYGQTDHPEWQNEDGCCHLQLHEGLPTAIKFRPIRPAEQIAADQREKAIMEMIEDTGFCADDGLIWPAVEALYKAGYRKQVQP